MSSAQRETAYQLSPEVARLVTDDFLSGHPLGKFDEFRSEVGDFKINLGSLQRLQEEALERFGPNDSECDTWLAPRLHNALRLSRRNARNQGFWRWMALVVMDRYVRHRWSDGGVVKAYRYLGGSNFLRRNAVSRLWWGAEAMRNGADYREVDSIFRSSGLEQYVLDLRFGHLRASALALARVGLGRSGVRPLSFDELKDLSKRANLLLSATALESLAPPARDEIGETDTGWLEEDPNVEILVQKKTVDLRGPSDGKVSEEEIREYERWYVDIATRIVEETKPAHPSKT